MSDTLGALLRGFNNGVGTGLDLYKTVQSEARAKRQEEYTRERASLEDARWERNWDRQVKQDEQTQANRIEDRAWEREKYDLEQKRLQAAAEATAAYRNAQLARSDRAFALQAAGHKLKVDKEHRANSEKMFGDGLTRFKTAMGSDPEVAMDMLSSDYTVKIPVIRQMARANGLNIPDDLAAELHPIRQKDGSYIVARRVETEDGQGGWAPFDIDPEKDGSQGIVLPSNVFVQTFGGNEGSSAVSLLDTKRTMAGAVDAAAAAHMGQAPAIEAELAGRTAEREKAEFLSEFEANGPRAEYIRQRETALESAPVDAITGDAVVSDPTTGRTQTLSNGLMGGRQGYRADLNEHRAGHERAVNEAQGTLSAALNSERTAAERLEALPKQAEGLKTDWAQVESLIARDVKKGDQEKAIKASAETFAVSPALARRYPGSGLRDATEAARGDQAKLVDRIVGSLDAKTVEKVDSKGKVSKESLEGAKANMKAVLLSMSPELWITLDDHTMAAEGALTKASQGAMSAGIPEAVPFLLYADKLGVDSQEAIKLMQDPSLHAEKDPKVRFEKAVSALEKHQRGEASTPVVGLGMVLQGK